MKLFHCVYLSIWDATQTNPNQASVQTFTENKYWQHLIYSLLYRLTLKYYTYIYYVRRRRKPAWAIPPSPRSNQHWKRMLRLRWVCLDASKWRLLRLLCRPPRIWMGLLTSPNPNQKWLGFFLTSSGRISNQNLIARVIFYFFIMSFCSCVMLSIWDTAAED